MILEYPFIQRPQTPIHSRFGLLAMLKVCFQLLGSGRPAPADKEHTRKKEPGRSLLLEGSFQSSRDISVRIVHAGGREELYETTLPAAELMEKYPGMCIARPEVFKNPLESLLPPEEELLTGQKYLMIPSSTAQKLKRKQRERVKAKTEEEMAYATITPDAGKEISEEAFCSAKDFYSSKGSVKARSTMRPSRRKSSRTRKPLVPPIRRGRPSGGFGWKPGLTSIQELSP